MITLNDIKRLEKQKQDLIQKWVDELPPLKSLIPNENWIRQGKYWNYEYLAKNVYNLPLDEAKQQHKYNRYRIQDTLDFIRLDVSKPHFKPIDVSVVLSNYSPEKNTLTLELDLHARLFTRKAGLHFNDETGETTQLYMIDPDWNDHLENANIHPDLHNQKFFLKIKKEANLKPLTDTAKLIHACTYLPKDAFTAEGELKYKLAYYYLTKYLGTYPERLSNYKSWIMLSTDRH